MWSRDESAGLILTHPRPGPDSQAPSQQNHALSTEAKILRVRCKSVSRAEVLLRRNPVPNSLSQGRRARREKIEKLRSPLLCESTMIL